MKDLTTAVPVPFPRSTPEPLLTVDEVAAMLSMSAAWVRQHSSGSRQPSIASVKLGKSVRFRRIDVDEFIRLMVRAA